MRVAEDPDDLVERIRDALTLDRQYTERVVAGDDDRVALVRWCGRRAGRLHGLRVRTFALDHVSGAVDVWVVNVEEEDPDDEIARQRTRRAIDQAFARWPRSQF